MSVPALPATLVPPAPFPVVIAQSMTSEFVAPGVRRATYRLQTSSGPLVVNVVAVDPSEPSVRVHAVLANDRLVSSGETVGAMARRTNAIAGVNADYFDIGNTNQPLNLVVRDGALLRSPSKRVVLDVRTDRSVHFENVAMSGTLRFGSSTLPLTTINEWPPQGGVGFLSEAYGLAKAAPGVRIAQIVPVDVEHPPFHPAGVFRIASFDDATRAHTVHGYELVFGPAALAFGALPAIGDAVTVDVASIPTLADVTEAVGGGPMLVTRGFAVDDPNSPAPEERDRRFPVSGAATLADGEVLLLCVDGRSPLSVGLTRPEFAALARGFNATDAMAFDSGGSAELVARVLGDAQPSVLGKPSDGEERAVADGLFVYSDAPVGPPARLVVRPDSIVAMAGARVAVRAAIVDAAGHALAVAHLDGGDVVRVGATSSQVTVRSGTLAANVGVDVVDRLTRLDLESETRHPEPGATITLRATGFDVRGRVVAIGPSLRVRGARGEIDVSQPYQLGDRDERFVVRAGGARTTLELRVGRHSDALRLFDAATAKAWSFASAPAGVAREITFANEPPEMRIPYDFTRDERAAYARSSTGFALPGEPLAFAIEIAGDGSGVGLRATFVNGLGEMRALTLAKAVDWNGWQRRSIVLPDDLSPPVRLTSLYVVNTLGPHPARTAGTIAFRNPFVTVAGRP